MISLAQTGTITSRKISLESTGGSVLSIYNGANKMGDIDVNGIAALSRLTLTNTDTVTNPFIVKNSSNANVFYVSPVGNVVASGGLTATAIYSNAAAGINVMNGATPKITLAQSGTIDCTALNVNGNSTVRSYTEIVALNSVTSTTSSSTGAASPGGWTYNYVGNGGYQTITIYITCYTITDPVARTRTIRKNGNTVVTGTFYFNNAAVHTAMPPLIYIDTTGMTFLCTWSVYCGAGVLFDTSDTCTMTIAEY
jgi:hypothetical protein